MVGAVALPFRRCRARRCREPVVVVGTLRTVGRLLRGQCAAGLDAELQLTRGRAACTRDRACGCRCTTGSASARAGRAAPRRPDPADRSARRVSSPSPCRSRPSSPGRSTAAGSAGGSPASRGARARTSGRRRASSCGSSTGRIRRPARTRRSMRGSSFAGSCVLFDQGQQSADVAGPHLSLRGEDARPHESGVAVVDGHHRHAGSTRARMNRQGRHGNRSAGKDRDQTVPAASHRSTYPEAVGPVTAIGAPASGSVRSSGLTISAKWQALGCPCPRSISAGSSSAQIGCAFQQRVRKRQPDGGFAGFGTSPSSTMRFRLPALRRILDRDRRQQRLRVRVRRALVDVVPRPDLDDLAEVHDRDAIGDVTDEREVVGDEQVRETEVALQRLEQVDDLRADRDVERRDGLVEHDHLWVERERAGEADALPLPAGELVREPVRVLGAQAHRAQQLVDRAPCPPCPCRGRARAAARPRSRARSCAG